ncbi:MAG: hypothetical protein J5U17_11035 [Candidatus Methanoperedens sp.]|nr:hypothetical protein [Candidatus Methanoperedens sp.]MCE8429590.1 hypothetical protein [Candidatus Methanoperedens sp.]
MEIYCKICKSKIPASNIDSNRLIAKCDRCNSVIEFKDEVSKTLKIPKIGEIKLPKKITIDTDKFGLNITIRWFRYLYLFLAFFVVFLDVFIIRDVMRNREYFMSGNYNTALSVLIGIFLTYLLLIGLINKTYIMVNPQSLIIKQGPIPGWGNKNLNTGELKQFYSKKEESHYEDGTTSYSYELHAITRSGKDIKLLSSLENTEQLLFIEQEIEKFLGIKDENVEGEIII